eukprot:12408421-Karenia_brevis.AAC.1
MGAFCAKRAAPAQYPVPPPPPLPPAPDQFVWTCRACGQLFIRIEAPWANLMIDCPCGHRSYVQFPPSPHPSDSE